MNTVLRNVNALDFIFDIVCERERQRERETEREREREREREISEMNVQ
jgi:transcription elongation factor Elf1